MSYRFLEAEDWNALIARVETIEGMGGAPHTFDSHTDVDAYSEAQGDIPHWDGDSWAALPLGSANQLIVVSGGDVAWASSMASFNFTSQLDVDGLSLGRVYTDSLDPKVNGGNVHIMPGQSAGVTHIGYGGSTPTIVGTELRVPWISYSSSALLLQGTGEHDVSLFEGQTTSTQRYLRVFGPNSANYLRLSNDGTHSQIYNPTGTLYLDVQSVLTIRAKATDSALAVRMYPRGTADQVYFLMKNAEHTGNYAQLYFGIDGAIAYLGTNVYGSGTPVTVFKFARDGRMDVSLYEDQTTTTERSLDIYQGNSSNYLTLYVNSSGLGKIDGSGITQINMPKSLSVNGTFFTSAGVQFLAYDGGNEGAEVFLASPLGIGNETPNKPSWRYDVFAGSLRFRSWDGSTDKVRFQIDSANNKIKLDPVGFGNVTLFEDETDTTERFLQVFAANSSDYLAISHDGTDASLSASTGILRSTTSIQTYQEVIAGNPITGSYKGSMLSQDGAIEIWRGTDGVPFIDFKTDYATDYDARIQKTITHGFVFRVGGTGSLITGLDLSETGELTLIGTQGNNTDINTFSTDGTLAGDSDDAVPTEQAVKTYVASQAGGGGTSTLQRHVVMDMQPYDGATWDFENGAAILINADSQKIHAEGMIPDGVTRFKVLVWSEHITSSDTTYMQFKIDGKEDGDTSATAHHNVTSEWASTSANEQMVEDSGWQTLDAGDERIYVELERITAGGTDDLYVQAIALVFELDVGNTIGSSAKTELLVPCQIAPYDGAVWNYANGVSIFLDAVNQKVLATGYIPPDTEQIEVIIFGQHPSGSGSTSVTTTIKGQECGTTSTESYDTDTSAWTSTLANEQICKTLGWYATDADQERFFIEIKWNSGTDLHINEVVLNCFTPIVVSGTISQPSDSIPADMPDSATGGVSDDVSRADHVHPLTIMQNMDVLAAAGATLEFKEKHGVVLDLNGEVALGRGVIQTGINRYRLHVWYGHGSAPQNSNIDLYMHDAGDDDSANGWNRINGDALNWASTTTDDAYLYSSSWFTVTGTFPKAVWVRIIFDTGNGIRIWRMALELDTESS